MKKTLLATLIAGTALMAGQALAVPLDFDQRSGFDITSFVEGVPEPAGGGSLPLVNQFDNNTGAGYPAGTARDLSWRFTGGGDWSSLNVTTFHSGGSQTLAEGRPVGDVDAPGTSLAPLGPLSPTASTDGNGDWDEGEYWTITRLSQTNNVIAGFGTPLWSVIIDSNTTILNGATEILDQSNGDGTSAPFSFFETSNLVNLGDCNPPAPADTGACPDYYLALDAILDSVTTDDGLFVIDFDIVAVENAEIVPGLGPDGFFGVVTPEINNNVSVVDIRARYTAIPVPIPGTLALLGLGLVGLGYRSRRRNNG